MCVFGPWIELIASKCNSTDSFRLGSLTFSHAWGELFSFFIAKWFAFCLVAKKLGEIEENPRSLFASETTECIEFCVLIYINK